MHINSRLFTSVSGKCSLILCVVDPCIVFIKYVYGVVPSGVRNPVNKQIIIIIINAFTLLFPLIFILYGFAFIFSFLFIVFSFFCSNLFISSFIFCISSSLVVFSIFLFNLSILAVTNTISVFESIYIMYSAIYGRYSTK